MFLSSDICLTSFDNLASWAGDALIRGTTLGVVRGEIVFLVGPTGPYEREAPRAETLRVIRTNPAELPPPGEASGFSCLIPGRVPAPRWDTIGRSFRLEVAGTSLIALSCCGDRLRLRASLGVPMYADSGTWPDVNWPVEDMPLIAGTMGPGRMTPSGGPEEGTGDGRTSGTTLCIGPASARLPPPPEAEEGLALGEMSIRGEATTVGAGELGCDQNTVLVP
jgi:hypothetical protein